MLAKHFWSESWVRCPFHFSSIYRANFAAVLFNTSYIFFSSLYCCRALRVNVSSKWVSLWANINIIEGKRGLVFVLAEETHQTRVCRTRLIYSTYSAHNRRGGKTPHAHVEYVLKCNNNNDWTITYIPFYWNRIWSAVIAAVARRTKPFRSFFLSRRIRLIPSEALCTA